MGISDWPRLLPLPDDLGAESAVAGRWFSPLASVLLGCPLLVGDHRYRLMEIEFYYFSARHSDPFAHCNPIQREPGRWYFHRCGGTYRNGSFKGLDLTFGSGGRFGGILIRSMAAADGTVVCGPSLCVDRLLAAAGMPSVAELDEAIGGKTAWEKGCPLMLGTPAADVGKVFRSARVGLSLKKVARAAASCRFLMRPYRYLMDPHRLNKGKLHIALALHMQGTEVEEICRLTRCPKKAVRGYIQEYETGRADADFAPYWGVDLGPGELCRLHGVWHAQAEAGRFESSRDYRT